MTSDPNCPPPARPPRDDANPPRLVPPDPGPATLVQWPGTAPTRTTVFNADAVASMQRGLKELIEQASIDDSGATVRFRSVDMTWAEPNEQGEYPAAAVLIEGKPEFDAGNLSPRVFEHDKMPDESYVDQRSEVTAMLLVVAHCATPGERNLIARMLEVALNPVDWMAGFYLDLPYYGGQRATYLPVRAEYKDDATLARHNLRPIEITVEARICEVIPRKPPMMKPQIVVIVGDPADPAPENAPGVPSAPLELTGSAG